MLRIFINNSSFLEPNSKYIFKSTDFTYNPPFVFGQIISRLIFQTSLMTFFLVAFIISFNF